jgi:hypothetical protein
MDKYAEASEKYKPDKIKYLIVAESPPKNPDNYFYFLDVKKHDGFYLEIINALYCHNRIDSKCLRDNKDKFLKCFQRDGFYLIDAVETRIESSKRKDKEKAIRESLPGLRKRLDCHCDPETKVILIVATVFDVCFQELKSKDINVINEEKIPYPGNGQQKVFRQRLTALLRKHGWEKGDCNLHRL